MTRLSLLFFALCIWGMALAQKGVADEVNRLKAEGQQFKEVSLLKFQTNDVHSRGLNLGGLKKGTVLTIDQEKIHDLFKGQNDYIEMSVPVSDRAEMKLNLYRHDIFTPDFALYTSEHPNQQANYTPGLYYRGTIDGDPNSIVAISIFNDEIIGLISNANGNYVLGRIENDRENKHILYNDSDLERKSDFNCSTVDDGPGYTEEELSTQPHSRDAGDCVRVYIEIDDDIVTAKGGAVPATNYITAMFNQSFVLYANEQITMTISQIYAWTTNSPYTGTTASAMLTSYQDNTGEFNGNVSILVSYATSGGIAVLDGLCQTNPDWRKCFASIDGVYSNVPTYSWDVMVVTHEMGHVVGSKHTHACAWNGNNTAIDGCAGSVEGSCPLPGIPPQGGTIMSYCHLQSVGINFTLGFGPQPGNVIRSRVNAAGNCLTTCGPPPPPPPPSYCTSNGTNSNYEYINKVVLGSINNTSGNNGGYGNFTSQSTNLTPGTNYTITLTPGYSSGTYAENWRVWIDYNGDLDWVDQGEQVAQGSGSGALTIAFTVPAGTAAGTKRMRVSMEYGALPPICGSFTYGEVEDYTIVIGSGPPSGTCNDGIQNQGETGIDCGGPCAPCPPTPTCSDGIQNQGETGIDCGGPCPVCPPPPPPTGTVLNTGYFETGWDGWIDGGVDAARVTSAYSFEGTHSIQLRDNSGTQSAMTSPTFNLSNAVGVQVTFHFYAYSMEVGEDFWLQYKSGTGNWVTIASYIRGTNFNNNTFYITTVTLSNFTPTSAGTFRIQCDASDDFDQVYIDAVTITSLNGPALIESGTTIEEVAHPTVVPNDLVSDATKELKVYPNPATDELNISFNGEIQSVRIVSLEGKVMSVTETNEQNHLIDISQLAKGIYFISVQSGGEWYPTKFSKM